MVSKEGPTRNEHGKAQQEGRGRGMDDAWTGLDKSSKTEQALNRNKQWK